MIKTKVDFSIFVGDTTSFGRVHGTLELPAVPTVGAIIPLSFPVAPGVEYQPVLGFSGQLAIETVLLAPGQEEVMIELSDVFLDTMSDAKLLARYLESGFKLFVDENVMDSGTGTAFVNC